MFTRLLAIATLLSVLLCSGCEEPEPEYQASIVKYDPRLVGVWEAKLQDDTRTKLTITPRARVVQQDRVLREKLDDTQDGLAPNAVTVLFEVHAPVLKDVSGQEKWQHIEIELKGLTLEIDGMTFIALQPSAKQMGAAQLGAFALPVHRIAKYEFVDERLQVWAPDTNIAWLPGVQWLDAPAEISDEPVLSPAGEDLVVTNDIDRLVKVIRSQSKIEGFWQMSQEFTRTR